MTGELLYRRGRACRVVALIIVAGLLAGCEARFGAQSGSTKQGEHILDLWRVMVVIALVILALVVGLVVWCVVRYRRRSAQIPTQRQYHIPIEVIYTTVPFLVLAVMVGLSWRTQNEVDALAPRPAVVIEATGFQWQWQFVYPNAGVTVTGLPDKRAVMVIPVDETVRIRLTSRDVIHSMFVPEFLFKRDAIPGVVNRFDFTATTPGRYVSRCAEFCGLDHAQMLFDVEVVPRSEFDRWVERHAEGTR